MGESILVTGANGFVGSALCRLLHDSGFAVRGALRDIAKCSPRDCNQLHGIEWVLLQDRSTDAETLQALHGVQTVIHLAARVHIMEDRAGNPLGEFRRINTDWTERLARAAARQDVRRFVYMSSIKVNGEESTVPFTEDDTPNPQDPYGVSKWEAEQALATVSSETGLETVIVRSPLVYGPRVGGNFLQLMKIVRAGIPLPLARVGNRRSLIFLRNLVEALLFCAQDKRAAGRTYLVSDGEDLSTPDLIRRVAKALRVTARLWPMPIGMLKWMAQIVGKKAMIERLIGSLQVNSSRIGQELDWYPAYSVDQGLAETCSWFSGAVRP